VRACAARVLVQVLRQGRSLAAVLAPGLANLRSSERPLGQELCYGTLRWYPRLAAIADSLLSRSLKDKDADVHCLILLGLYQLLHTRVPDHAALAETVAGAQGLGKPWAKGLVNAVLRRFQRERAAVLAGVDGSEATACAHPDWLLGLLKAAWPGQWQAIVAANNARPPMTLRVNARRVSRGRGLPHRPDNTLIDIHKRKPIGVADYELTHALPKELASSLPSIEQIEAELQGELDRDRESKA